MIVPEFRWDDNGDAVFFPYHLSESKEDSKKDIFDRKHYQNKIVVNPLTKEIVTIECGCDSFTKFNKDEPCKHIKQSIEWLGRLGFVINKEGLK